MFLYDIFYVRIYKDKLSFSIQCTKKTSTLINLKVGNWRRIAKAIKMLDSERNVFVKFPLFKD